MPPSPPEDRRQGLIRAPFVRRCRLELGGGRSAPGYTVNINLLGAYVSPDAATELPVVGQTVRCRFPSERGEKEADGVVSWVNSRQVHPVHGLPPGFGLRFGAMDEDLRRLVEQAVRDYLVRQPP